MVPWLPCSLGLVWLVALRPLTLPDISSATLVPLLS